MLLNIFFAAFAVFLSVCLALVHQPCRRNKTNRRSQDEACLKVLQQNRIKQTSTCFDSKCCCPSLELIHYQLFFVIIDTCKKKNFSYYFFALLKFIRDRELSNYEALNRRSSCESLFLKCLHWCTSFKGDAQHVVKFTFLFPFWSSMWRTLMLIM